METALSIRDLKKTYPGGTEALKGVSLDVPAGDFFALLGPNGAGKTTMIGIIAGLTNKTSGEVKVFDTDIDRDHDTAKTHIGLVPQEMNFNIFEKVIDIVVTQAGFYGLPREQALKNAEEDLKRLGLWEKRNDASRTLSGGMKRRLMIARALVHRPKLLILDEPTAGVDIELRRGMWDYLRDLQKSGVTIILTTHYLEEAEQLAKRLAIINQGAIVKQGSMREVLRTLDSETLIFDTKEDISKSALESIREGQPVLVDNNTVEVTVSSGYSLSEAVRALGRAGVTVVSVREKSNRLEELFVRITGNNHA